MIYNMTGKTSPWSITWGFVYTLDYGFPAIWVGNGKPVSIILLELIK